MKNLKLFALMALFLAFMTACGGEEGSDNGSEASTEESAGDPGEAATDTDGAVSTWDGHSLREDADGSSKWLASVSFGEKMTLLGENKEGPKRTYEKVRLLDGKEGWVREDLIHAGGRYGVITASSQVYKRPSVSNITEKNVDVGTLVVIKQTNEEFQEFISINDKSNNRIRGWVLGNSVVSTSETDVAVGVIINKAQKESNPAKRTSLLETVTNNDAYKSSILYDMAVEMVGAASEPPRELGSDELMITGDNVNVRSEPNTASGEKLFQLFSGDIVLIVAKGDMEEIGGNLDYWYKVRTDSGQEGWLFGQFTSKSLN